MGVPYIYDISRLRVKGQDTATVEILTSPT